MTKSEKPFVVYSLGAIREDYDIEQVSKSIGLALRKDPRLVRVHLINSQRNKIKSFATIEQALHLHDLLASRGLEVVVENRSNESITISHSYLTMMPEISQTEVTRDTEPLTSY